MFYAVLCVLSQFVRVLAFAGHPFRCRVDVVTLSRRPWTSGAGLPHIPIAAYVFCTQIWKVSGVVYVYSECFIGILHSNLEGREWFICIPSASYVSCTQIWKVVSGLYVFRVPHI